MARKMSGGELAYFVCTKIVMAIAKLVQILGGIGMVLSIMVIAWGEGGNRSPLSSH